MEIRKSSNLSPGVPEEESTKRSTQTLQSSGSANAGVSALQDALENVNLPNAFRSAVEPADTGVNSGQNQDPDTSQNATFFERPDLIADVFSFSNYTQQDLVGNSERDDELSDDGGSPDPARDQSTKSTSD